jgi:hypothetical protein
MYVRLRLRVCFGRLCPRARSPILDELVDGLVHALGRDVMKILLVDRGLVDGAQIGRLKQQYRIDTIVPLAPTWVSAPMSSA